MRYYCNNENDLSRFTEIFGTAWEKAAGLEKRLGAFLLLDDEERAVADENAALCFGIPEGGVPDHAELKGMIASAGGASNVLDIALLDTGSGVTAGFVKLKENDARGDIHFGLCSRKEFAEGVLHDPDAVIMALSAEGIAGDGDTESFVFSAADAVFSVLPKGALMTRSSDSEFRLMLPSSAGDPEEIAERLAEAVRVCSLRDRYGSLLSEKHSMSLAIGICGGRNTAAGKLHGAEFALYEARSGKDGGIRVFRPEKYESRKAEYDSIMKFNRLISENLFIYHFQPIVSAASGEIVAYEALMRSSPVIGYGPLEILDIAAKRGRLYDIERATMRNALAALSENQSFFDSRKLFINSIPSQLLTVEDYSAFRADFGELLEKTVIEFTEHSEVSDRELAAIRERLAAGGMKLAIDDYGTGYSNTSNLMRYAPDYVKIDRSLIAGIENDPKRQALVSGIIEFVHSTGCMALAEGVETIDEVRTVINLSIDLLQGFYVSRPKPVFINEISESIREEIVRINLEAQNKIQKVYKASDGETLDLSALALEKYTDIFIEGGSVVLEGEHGADRHVKLPITVKENTECDITVRSVLIEPEPDVPALTLSHGSRVRLNCEGVSRFEKSMIFVPEGSELRISGMGELTVNAETQDCYGIGSSHNSSFGSVIIDMDGRLDVIVNGENGIGIGGGKNGSIRVVAGSVNVTANGNNVVGIGSFEGSADIDLHDCGVFVTAAAATAVCIGSMHGSASVRMSNIAAGLIAQGNNICAAGTLGGGLRLKANDMKFTTELRGRSILNMGSVDGGCECTVARAAVTLYSEGHSVTAFGDRTGGGSINISSSEINVTFLTGDDCIFACPEESLVLDNVVRSVSLND